MTASSTCLLARLKTTLSAHHITRLRAMRICLCQATAVGVSPRKGGGGGDTSDCSAASCAPSFTMTLMSGAVGGSSFAFRRKAMRSGAGFAFGAACTASSPLSNTNTSGWYVICTVDTWSVDNDLANFICNGVRFAPPIHSFDSLPLKGGRTYPTSGTSGTGDARAN